jgi:hypothetical protein
MDLYVIQVLQEDRWLTLAGGSLHSRSDEAVADDFATYEANNGVPASDTAIHLVQRLATESRHLKRSIMRVARQNATTGKVYPVWEQIEAGKPEGCSRG